MFKRQTKSMRMFIRQTERTQECLQDKHRIFCQGMHKSTSGSSVSVCDVSEQRLAERLLTLIRKDFLSLYKHQSDDPNYQKTSSTSQDADI